MRLAHPFFLPILAYFMSACAHTRGPVPGPIVTDRPDETEGTDLVPTGWWQVEGGVTAYNPRHGPQIREAGELLLRYGAGRRFEARVGLPSVITTEGSRREFGDGSLGVKTPLLIPRSGASRAVPALSLLASTAVHRNWSDGPALGTPEIILAAAWGLTDRLDVAGNVVTEPFSSYSADRFVGLTLATGFELTERLGTYAEVYNLGTPTLNGGLTYRLTPGFQVDGRIGVSDFGSHFRHTVFTGVGFGLRW